MLQTYIYLHINRSFSEFNEINLCCLDKHWTPQRFDISLMEKQFYLWMGKKIMNYIIYIYCRGFWSCFVLFKYIVLMLKLVEKGWIRHVEFILVAFFQFLYFTNLKICCVIIAPRVEKNTSSSVVVRHL